MRTVSSEYRQIYSSGNRLQLWQNVRMAHSRKTMKITKLLPLLLLCPCQFLFGQTDDLKWRLSGRMHFDGVSYISSPDTMCNQLDMVDLRLGGKVNLGNWYLNVDVSFSDNKVSVKDAFLQYSQFGNYFRAGHQYVFTGIVSV